MWFYWEVHRISALTRERRKKKIFFVCVFLVKYTGVYSYYMVTPALVFKLHTFWLYLQIITYYLRNLTTTILSFSIFVDFMWWHESFKTIQYFSTSKLIFMDLFTDFCRSECQRSYSLCLWNVPPQILCGFQALWRRKIIHHLSEVWRVCMKIFSVQVIFYFIYKATSLLRAK